MKTVWKIGYLVMVVFLLSFAPVQDCKANAPPEQEQVVTIDTQKTPAVTVIEVTPEKGGWVDPSLLPNKDPGGLLGLGWEYLAVLFWGFITLLLYFYPTASKWTWLTWIIDLLEFILPNMKKGGGTHAKASIWDFIFHRKE